MTGAGYLVFAIQGALLALALWRGKHDRIVMVLCVAFCVSSVMGPSIDEGTKRDAALAVIDSLIVLGMALLWTVHDDMRAWFIGVVGMGKVAVRMAHVTDPHMDHLIYASVINCALVAQIVAAGGFADAVGYRLDDLFRRIAPKRHGLLRNGHR